MVRKTGRCKGEQSVSEKERMLAGELFSAVDKELLELDKRARFLTHEFNTLSMDYLERRASILKELFGEVGAGTFIEPPLHCDYGVFTHLGKNFFANFGLVLLDGTGITIGDDVMFGPRVCLTTATHPIDPVVRTSGLEYGQSITIGDRVWLGAQVVVNPGVSIGENTVIGSGSVVTKDIPANVVAAGNPCRVLRAITENDAAYWQTKQAAYWAAVERERTGN